MEKYHEKSVVERSKSISRVFQDPKLGTAVRLTVEENLALAMKRGKNAASSVVSNHKTEHFSKTSWLG